MKPWLRIRRRHIWITLPSNEDSVAFMALAVFMLVALFGLTYSYEQERESANEQQQRNKPNLNQQDSSNQEQRSDQQSIERDRPWWQTGTAADWALVVIGGLTAWAAVGTLRSIDRDVKAATRAAGAAKKSADIAEQALHLLNQPWLDTDDWDVQEQRGPALPDGDGGYIQELTGLTVTFNIVNNSRTPVTLHEIEITDVGSGSPPTDWTSTASVGNLLTPGAKYPCEAHILVDNMTDNQIQRYENSRGFLIEIRGNVSFDDVFAHDRERNRKRPRRRRYFGRNCILKKSDSSFLYVAGAERVDTDPYPYTEEGQPEDQP